MTKPNLSILQNNGGKWFKNNVSKMPVRTNRCDLVEYMDVSNYNALKGYEKKAIVWCRIIDYMSVHKYISMYRTLKEQIRKYGKIPTQKENKGLYRYFNYHVDKLYNEQDKVNYRIFDFFESLNIRKLEGNIHVWYDIYMNMDNKLKDNIKEYMSQIDSKGVSTNRYCLDLQKKTHKDLNKYDNKKRYVVEHLAKWCWSSI